MSVYIGLDIGGTKLMVAAADGAGEITRRARDSTPLDLREGLDMLHRMIAEVAAGGPIAVEQGVVSPLHQPGWRDVPLKALMEQRWGCPFYVDVDTNVAAVGEYA